MKDVLLAVVALAAATVAIVAIGLTFLWFGHMVLIALDAVWTASRAASSGY